MIIDGKEYTDGEITMLLRAVKRVLTVDGHPYKIVLVRDSLRDTAVHIGLVTKEESK